MLISHQPGNHPLQVLLVLCDMLLYVGALGGTLLGRLAGKKFSLVWVVPLFLTVVHAALHSEARYRLPFVPLLCIVAAGSIRAADPANRRAVTADRRSRMVLAGGLVLIAVCYVVAGWIFVSGRV